MTTKNRELVAVEPYTFMRRILREFDRWFEGERTFFAAPRAFGEFTWVPELEVFERGLFVWADVQAPRRLFAFPPGTGDAGGFLQVAERLPGYAFHSFNFIGAEDRLSQYADLVTGIDPDGPYLFLGYSSGGNLACQVAAEIERRGGRVSDILMIDSGRKLAPTPFAPGEVRRIAEEFLSHESIRGYLTSPALVERAHRLIAQSYAWVEQAVDRDVVDANIHVLTADESPDEHRDADGHLLASRSGWASATRGAFTVHRGEGSHNHMLHQPYLDRNIAAMTAVLDAAWTAARSSSAPAARPQRRAGSGAGRGGPS